MACEKCKSSQIQEGKESGHRLRKELKTQGMSSGDTLLVLNACSIPLSYPDLGGQLLNLPRFMELLWGLNEIILVKCLAWYLLQGDHSISVRLYYWKIRGTRSHTPSQRGSCKSTWWLTFSSWQVCAAQSLHWMQLDLDGPTGSFILHCKSGVVGCPGWLFCKHKLELFGKREPQLKKVCPQDWPVGKPMGAFSWLMFNVGVPSPLWAVPILDRWFWVVQESSLRKPRGASQ